MQVWEIGTSSAFGRCRDVVEEQTVKDGRLESRRGKFWVLPSMSRFQGLRSKSLDSGYLHSVNVFVYSLGFHIYANVTGVHVGFAPVLLTIPRPSPLRPRHFHHRAQERPPHVP